MQRRLRQALTLAPALWLVTGCASAPVPTPSPSPSASVSPSASSQVPSSTELLLAPGDTRPAGPLELTFEGVAEDSRCPLGVQCIWEGDARVLLTVRSPSGDPARLELHTSRRFAREAVHAGLRLTLVSLTPEPGKGSPVKAQDYRALVTVSADTH